MDTEEAELLAELKAISNAKSDARYNAMEKKVIKVTAEVGEGESSDCGDAFLKNNPEDPTTNQYWYSKPTINALAGECSRVIKERTQDDKTFKVAFLSTPSLYFALTENLREHCFVFDYDRKWENDRGFLFYDYNKPTTFEGDLKGELLSKQFYWKEEKRGLTCEVK